MLKMKELGPKTQLNRKEVPINNRFILKNPLARAAIGGAVFLASTVSAMACDKTEISDGFVYEKKHEEERIWSSVIVIPVGKALIPIPQTHVDDEDWIIKIRKCPEASAEPKTCHSEDFYVNKATYDGLNIGDYVNFNGLQGVEKTDPEFKRKGRNTD
jgi:hypothetical protein